MTREELAAETRKLVALHHDAFLVELFGEEGSGLDEERLAELREAELVGDLLTFADVPPYEFMLLASHVFGNNPDRLAELREQGIEEFEPLVSVQLRDLRNTERSTVEVPEVATPSAPEEPEDAPPRSPPPAPDWMSVAERGAYERLSLRAGEYIRGLGNALSEELENVAAEGWQGEEIIEEVNPEQRAEMLAILREEAANESASGRDARRLAGTLADRSKYYAHNWERIAQTELQGAHNEGRVIAASEAYGDEAQVARIPESGACDQCLRLFTEDGGRPRVFAVDKLTANGVNVGRSRADWLPTVFPIHPNCRCDTITVPQGFVVTEDGRLRRPETLTEES